MNRILLWIMIAWLAAWAIAIGRDDGLLMALAGFCFVQNIAFTFVSRGRNSGSIAYHLVASIFSNGIYILNFIFGMSIVFSTMNDGGTLVDHWDYVAVYTLSCMSGSIFAHWLAKKLERGKARNVQADMLAEVSDRLRRVELRMPFKKDDEICIPDPDDHQLHHVVPDDNQVHAIATGLGDLEALAAQMDAAHDDPDTPDPKGGSYYEGGKL